MDSLCSILYLNIDLVHPQFPAGKYCPTEPYGVKSQLGKWRPAIKRKIPLSSRTARAVYGVGHETAPSIRDAQNSVMIVAHLVRGPLPATFGLGKRYWHRLRRLSDLHGFRTGISGFLSSASTNSYLLSLGRSLAIARDRSTMSTAGTTLH